MLESENRTPTPHAATRRHAENRATKASPDGRRNVSEGDDLPSGARVNPRRVILGGVTIIAAIGGFLALRVVVATAGYPAELELFAMPAFGILGVVGFVTLVAGVVPAEDRPDGDEN